MENWIFLFLGLILAYLLEFTRPWVKSVYERSVFSSRVIRIRRVLIDYWDTKKYKENPSLLILDVLADIIIVIFFLFIVVIMRETVSFYKLETKPSRIYDIAYWAEIATFVLAFTIGYSRILPLRNRIDDIHKFEEYRKKTVEKLIKLGVNRKKIDNTLDSGKEFNEGVMLELEE